MSSKIPTFQVPEVKAKVKKSVNQTIDNDLPPFSLPSSGGAGNYGVRVVNGKMADAGTTNWNVFVQLVGTEGSTGKLHLVGLMQYLRGGLDRGTYQDLIVETETSLGEVQVVVLGIDSTLALDSTWFVQYTVVYDFSQPKPETQFPCYHWISGKDAVTTTAKTTTIKEIKDNPVLLQEREEQLTRRKLQYQWQFFPESGMPSGIDDTVSDLPADEEFSRVKNVDFTRDALKGFVTTTAAGVDVNLDNMGGGVNSLQDYVDLTNSLDQHELYLHRTARWTSDVEFGRQMLNGVNPVVIEKCTALPSNFPVTNALVQPFLTRGLTLEQEMEAGHIYICDMKLMDGLQPREGHYAPAPICLLYVNSAQQLVPIAIQIKQGVREEEKKEPNPIFVPSDDRNDWLLAKIYYQCAHAQFHELSTHYQSCHAVMEAYAMATMRNLPDAHPIAKLLHPHFRFTMAINVRARETLINKGGVIDKSFSIGGAGKEEIFKRASGVYSVEWTNIRKSVKRRGVDDPDQLPGYYYRDDGFKVFSAIEDYVRDVVNAFYPSDADVKSDPELQNWTEDMHTNAFPGYFGAEQGHGFPKTISTKEELIERCTVIIFTGSAQHASINFGQYAIYGFVPNAPFAVRQPAPSKKKADYQALLDTLPDVTTAKESINLTYLLSQYSATEVYLGDYPHMRFTESNIQGYIERFQKRLDGIEGEIKVRNESLDVPYTYMLPTRIPNSITI